MYHVFEDISNNYKKQLKELIFENLSDLVFVKSKQKNKPDTQTKIYIFFIFI